MQPFCVRTISKVIQITLILAFLFFVRSLANSVTLPFSLITWTWIFSCYNFIVLLQFGLLSFDNLDILSSSVYCICVLKLLFLFIWYNTHRKNVVQILSSLFQSRIKIGIPQKFIPLCSTWICTVFGIIQFLLQIRMLKIYTTFFLCALSLLQ